MAEEYVSWVLWLHATTLIRDGMAGKWASEEMHYYYKLSLKVMQEASQRKVEDYTDGFLCSLACFTACAVSNSPVPSTLLDRVNWLGSLTNV